MFLSDDDEDENGTGDFCCELIFDEKFGLIVQNNVGSKISIFIFAEELEDFDKKPFWCGIERKEKLLTGSDIVRKIKFSFPNTIYI